MNNRPQDRSRNQVLVNNAFESLMQKTDLGKLGVFFQFCGNPKCREITAVVLAKNGKISQADKKVFAKVAEKAHVPAILLEYPDQLVPTAMVYTSRHLENGTLMHWNQIIRFLAIRQIEHKKKSGIKACSDYKHQLLPQQSWRTKGDNYRFSNEIRVIPGVSHSYVDGILFCLDCGEPLFVIEATPNGCPNTNLSDRRTNIAMTRRVADKLGIEPILLQHSMGDKKNVKPVYITTYAGERLSTEEHNWLQIAIMLDTRAKQKHQCF